MKNDVDFAQYEEALEEMVGLTWEQNVADAEYRAQALARLGRIITPPKT
jgi:hypothetical protein